MLSWMNCSQMRKGNDTMRKFGFPRHWGKGSKPAEKENDSEELEYEESYESEESYDSYYDDHDDPAGWYSAHPLSMPPGCRACGGEYPMCRSGCPLYDDD